MENKNTNLTKIIIGGRGSGKTTYLIKNAARTGAVIVAASECHKRYILEMAAVIGVKIKTPLTVPELRARRDLNKEREPLKEDLILDDLDIWLGSMITSYLFGDDRPNVSIAAFSLNDHGNFRYKENFRESILISHIPLNEED